MAYVRNPDLRFAWAFSSEKASPFEAQEIVQLSWFSGIFIWFQTMFTGVKYETSTGNAWQSLEVNL